MNPKALTLAVVVMMLGAGLPLAYFSASAFARDPTAPHAPPTSTFTAAANPAPRSPDLHLMPSVGGTAYWNQVCQGGGTTVTARCIPQPVDTILPQGAWDANDSQFLLFGGDIANTYWSGTWALKFGTPHYTLLSPATVPAGRDNGSMVYDTTDHYPLLVGGYTKNGTAPNHFLNDIYKFSGGNWVLLSTPGGFERRAGGCLLDVPVNAGKGGYVVLYGGKVGVGTTAGAYLTSTWEYAAGVWSNVTATAGTLTPSARNGAGCAYSTADHYGVLFGGIGPGGALNDTWEWDPTANASGSWHRLSANGAAGAPDPRFYALMSTDSFAAKVVLFSGAYGTVVAPVMHAVGDTWTFSGGAWTNITTTVNLGPAGRLPCAGAGGYGSAGGDVPLVGAMKVNGPCVSASNSNETFVYGGNLTATNFATQPGEATLGTAFKLYANGSGGTGTYTYSYSGLPAGCASSNTALLTCTPNAAGVYTINATATDTVGDAATSLSFPIVVDSLGAISGTLSFGGTVNPAIRSGFFGADLWTNWSANHTLSSLLNATLIRSLHYYGQFDKTNVSAGYQGVQWSAGTSSASQLSYVTYNLSQYASLCRWLRGGCVSFLSVPGQTNDTGASVDDFKRMTTTFGLGADYVTIGTENDNFNHFGIPFASWRSSDNVAPTGLQLATQVRTVYGYIHALSPTTKIVIQLSAGNSFNKTLTAYAQNISAIDCGIVSAVSMDYYPTQQNNYGNPNLAAFYSNVSNMQNRLTRLHNNLAACPSIALWFSEFRATGGSSDPTSFFLTQLATYNEVPYEAANVAQALAGGMQGFGIWSIFQDPKTVVGKATQFSVVNTSTLATQPLYTLFASGALGHLPLGSAQALNVTAAIHHVFAVATSNATTTGLLVVNANTTIPLTLSTAQMNGAVAWTVYNETSTGVVKTTYAAGHGPATLFVGALSVLLVDENASSGGGVGLIGTAGPWILFGVAVLLFLIFALSLSGSTHAYSGRRGSRAM